MSSLSDQRTSIKQESDRRGRQRSSLLVRDVLECRTSHLTFWMDGGLVCCDSDDHPFFQRIHSAKYPFFYSSFLQIILALDRQFCPQTQPAATTFTFPAGLILTVFYEDMLPEICLQAFYAGAGLSQVLVYPSEKEHFCFVILPVLSLIVIVKFGLHDCG